MSTIKEVAELAKVSTATVSHVINRSAKVSPDLQKRVRAAIRKLDYRPNYVARSLKMQRTSALGMVVTDITDPFFAQMIRGAEDAARKAGYSLTIFNTDDKPDREEEVFFLLRARRVDGILLVLAGGSKTPRHVRKTIEDNIPVVCLARAPQDLRLDSVTIRNRENARGCVLHLVTSGHKRIAMIAGPSQVATSRERMLGYLDALHESGIPVDEGLIREGNYRWESGYLLGKELLAVPDRPTAIFVANGMMTVGLLKALDELNLRSPRDISIVAFGDRDVAEYLYRHVTVAAQPSYDIGRRGAELIIQRIQKSTSSANPMHIELDAPLEVKESS